MTRLQDWPAQERPRERLLALGPRALSDAELLALLLGSSRHATLNVVDWSRELLKQNRDLQQLSGLTVLELEKQHGLGLAKACALVAAFELGARSMQHTDHLHPLTISSSSDIYQFARPWLKGVHQEVFWGIALNRRNHVLTHYEIARGSLSSVDVHPREVFAPLIKISAASTILLHNHPSGDPQPSTDDILLTDRLKEVGALIGIPLIDHLIICDKGFSSLAEQGFI